MGLFGRKKKKDLTLTGLPGHAVITKEDWSDFDTGDDETSLADLGIGNRKFRFELEVTLDDGRPPYTVKGWFKVPAKLGIETGPGVTLPVYADPADPTNLDINWEQFVPENRDIFPKLTVHQNLLLGQKSGAKSARWTDKETRPSAVHDAMPDATRKQMVDGWVSAAKSGALTAEAFEEAISGAVESGMLTAEEGDVARKAVG